jgi:Mn2+/Fe2+ NRAMP family transporter
VGVGGFFSNMVMFFIILTTATTLNRHGITHIETTRQAAEALRPLAGRFAATLFTAGIVGVGFLAIPTLAGSTAYAEPESGTSSFWRIHRQSSHVTTSVRALRRN